MQARTKRQRQVLEYLTEFISERGYEPSYQQIARALGVRSKGAIAKHIDALENQGLVTRIRESGRFHLRIVNKRTLGEDVCGIDWLELPTSGETEKEPAEPLIVARSLLGPIEPEKMRVYSVPDDSMRKDHICEGDFALVEKRSFARDRDRVIALVDGERAVLKKFYRQGADIELRSASEEFETIRLSADKVEILGIYRGLVRPLA